MTKDAQNWTLLGVVALLIAAGVAWLGWSIAADTDASPGDRVAGPGRGGVDADATPAARSGPDGTLDLPRTEVAVAGRVDRGSVHVHGRVLDPFGEPLAGALVGDAGSDRPVVAGTDGRFAIHVPAGNSPVTLLVLARGHAPFLAPLAPIDAALPSQDAGDIQIVRGGAVRGRVTDAAEQPVPHATMTLRLLPGNGWPATLDPARLLAPTATDAAGSYAFVSLLPGRYVVTARADGRQAAQSSTLTVREGEVTVVDPIALAVGHALAGVVLDPAGEPVAGALVRARCDRPRHDAEVETGADGRFLLQCLPPGPLQVDVTRPGFQRFHRADVDAAAGAELVVRLEGGLRLTGTVVDARTGRPVEEFAAAIRRIGEIDPPASGTIEQQLQRHVDARTEPRPSREIATELAARLERVRRQAGARPVGVPPGMEPATARPEGRFAFAGLEEGLHAVSIASPDHQFARVEPIELRRGAPPPEIRVELAAGCAVSGIVVARPDDRPVAGADVELVCVDELAPAAEGSDRSLYPWVFARPGPRGVTVLRTRTAGDGRFALEQAPPGRYALQTRHPRITDHQTGTFVLQEDRRGVRIEVGPRASLAGRVRDLPAGRTSVEVLVLGGHGTLRTVRAGGDGSYRFADLQPGSYIVRAFPADATQYVSRLLGSIFPLHAGAVDKDKVPPRDVTLAEGEQRVLDLALDVQPTGTVEGTVTVNGQPGKGSQTILRPEPGEAPGAGGLALRGSCDDAGRFALADVPAGKYSLGVTGASRQELHHEPITVASRATVTVHVELSAGGLRGRITAPDAASPQDLRGYVWVLPGASEPPADLYEYRRAKRTHRIQVRDGVFQDDSITPGPAVVVVDLRGRARVSTTTVVPAGGSRELELTAASRSP